MTVAKTLAVIVPFTRDFPSLQRLLEALAPQLEASGGRADCWMVDNRRALEPRPELQAGIEQYRRCHYLHYPIPGREPAINHGIRRSESDLVTILDDDMVPAPGWVAGILRFFDETDYDMMQGRILPLPGDRLDDLDYPMVPTRDWGEERKACASLSGSNIAGRRRWFVEQPYLETVAVSLSGWGADNVFYRNLTVQGAQFGYEPDALAWHPVERERSNQRFFRRACYMTGKASCQWTRLSLLRQAERIGRNAIMYGLLRCLVPWNRRVATKYEAGLFRNLGRFVGRFEQKYCGNYPFLEHLESRPDKEAAGTGGEVADDH